MVKTHREALFGIVMAVWVYYFHSGLHYNNLNWTTRVLLNVVQWKLRVNCAEFVSLKVICFNQEWLYTFFRDVAGVSEHPLNDLYMDLKSLTVSKFIVICLCLIFHWCPFLSPWKLQGNTPGPKTVAVSAILSCTRRTRTPWMLSMCSPSSSGKRTLISKHLVQ